MTRRGWWPPVVLAWASITSPRTYAGVVVVTQRRIGEGDETHEHTEIERCTHRHRLARKARECATDMATWPLIRAAIAREIEDREGRA
jgi:hypothetical protein